MKIIKNFEKKRNLTCSRSFHFASISSVSSTFSLFLSADLDLLLDLDRDFDRLGLEFRPESDPRLFTFGSCSLSPKTFLSITVFGSIVTFYQLYGFYKHLNLTRNRSLICQNSIRKMPLQMILLHHLHFFELLPKSIRFFYALHRPRSLNDSFKKVYRSNFHFFDRLLQKLHWFFCRWDSFHPFQVHFGRLPSFQIWKKMMKFWRFSKMTKKISTFYDWPKDLNFFYFWIHWPLKNLTFFIKNFGFKIMTQVFWSIWYFKKEEVFIWSIFS